MLRKIRKKKSSAVPIFRSGRRSPIFARIRNKGKVGVQRGRETAGVPSFLPPRRAPQRPRRPQTANLLAESQRKTLRPERANTPAAVRAPHSAGAEKEPPRQGEHANAVRVPRSAGAEKELPGKGEPASGSSSTPHNRCRKGAAPSGRTRLRQFAHPAQPVQKNFSKIFKKLTIHGQFSPPSGIGLKEVTQ